MSSNKRFSGTDVMIACVLLDFGKETSRKHSSEENRLRLIVNRAQAYKWDGKEDECKTNSRSRGLERNQPQVKLPVRNSGLMLYPPPLPRYSAAESFRLGSIEDGTNQDRRHNRGNDANISRHRLDCEVSAHCRPDAAGSAVGVRYWFWICGSRDRICALE
jgi:hypothetical protein